MGPPQLHHNLALRLQREADNVIREHRYIVRHLVEGIFEFNDKF